VLGRRPQIVEYQVQQTPQGAAISVRCAHPGDLADVVEEIEGDLRAAGLSDPQVSVLDVDFVERLPQTGKLKRFLPLAETS
jgi:hypothetical protein